MKINWNGFCQRCLEKTASYSMSWFNEQLICLNCSKREAERSDYSEARKAETKAVRSGSFNYPGIGLKNYE